MSMRLRRGCSLHQLPLLRHHRRRSIGLPLPSLNLSLEHDLMEGTDVHRAHDVAQLVHGRVLQHGVLQRLGDAHYLRRGAMDSLVEGQTVAAGILDQGHRDSRLLQPGNAGPHEQQRERKETCGNCGKLEVLSNASNLAEGALVIRLMKRHLSDGIRIVAEQMRELLEDQQDADGSQEPLNNA